MFENNRLEYAPIVNLAVQMKPFNVCYLWEEPRHLSYAVNTGFNDKRLKSIVFGGINFLLL